MHRLRGIWGLGTTSQAMQCVRCEQPSPGSSESCKPLGAARARSTAGEVARDTSEGPQLSPASLKMKSTRWRAAFTRASSAGSSPGGGQRATLVTTESPALVHGHTRRAAERRRGDSNAKAPRRGSLPEVCFYFKEGSSETKTPSAVRPMLNYSIHPSYRPWDPLREPPATRCTGKSPCVLLCKERVPPEPPLPQDTWSKARSSKLVRSQRVWPAELALSATTLTAAHRD